MARGNFYLVIPDSELNEALPNKVAKQYKYIEYTQVGDVVLETPVENPTWQQFADRYRKKFGEPIPIVYNGENFTMVEIEASYIHGRGQQLRSLQNGQFPRFRALTATEAKALAKGEDIEIDPHPAAPPGGLGKSSK